MLTLYEGDCLDVLAELPEASIDAVVTDPPYHLTSIVRRFGSKSAAAAKTPEGGTGAFARASRGFMGQTWDGGDVAFRPETWAAVARVMKPGAHLVAFGGSRSWHRLACAIEDAGFEVRDSLAWLYGTGFPKSHDVAKGIEKMRVEDEEPTRRVCRYLRAAMDRAGLKSRDLAPIFDCHPRLVDHWAARDTDSQPNLPTVEQWARLRQIEALALGDEMDGEVERLNRRKGEWGQTYHEREIVGEVKPWESGINYRITTRDGLRRGGAVSPAAQEWEGWGTALKPAFEPIVLARKPLAERSVARQVLATRTGAINIDACRVPTTDDLNGGAYSNTGRRNEFFRNIDAGAGEFEQPPGRFPANVLHDGSDEAVGVFPGEGDKSASRFFYCAKAGKADRRGSKHPTVKPQALMRWCVRLVTPPGGVVLDPFAGSGSTAWAAHAEGCSAIAIEREAEFAADIRRGISEIQEEEGKAHA